MATDEDAIMLGIRFYSEHKIEKVQRSFNITCSKIITYQTDWKHLLLQPWVQPFHLQKELVKYKHINKGEENFKLVWN